jgi:kynurenine formamidase
MGATDAPQRGEEQYAVSTTNLAGPPMTFDEFDRLFEQLKNWGRWGADDQHGALNLITPERVREAAALVRAGRSVSLSLPWDKEVGPDNPSPAQHRMTGYPSTFRIGAISFALDFVGMEMHGDAHSHIDAICHALYRDRMYNGRGPETLSERGGSFGAQEITEHGIVGRGVMLDIPRLRGVKWIEPGEAIMAEELEAAERAQNVRLQSGDILLLRTGHHRKRLDEGAWDASVAKAGLYPTAMALLHERGVAVLGADGDGDAVPSATENVPYPIHALGIAAMGMHFMDSLQFEELAPVCEQEQRWAFLLVIAPLRVVGATGSPVNPIAIF